MLSKPLIAALIVTGILVLNFIILVIIGTTIVNVPFYRINMIQCILSHDERKQKECLCPTADSNACVATGKNWESTPRECKPCPQFPILLRTWQIIFLVLGFFTLLVWINVFTKTVKF